MTLDLNEHPHRRRNPLTGDWILVSPHRTRRPWHGRREGLPVLLPRRTTRPATSVPAMPEPAGQPTPGMRAHLYSQMISVHCSRKPRALPMPLIPLLRAQGSPGECRVICFSPRHDLTLADMSLPDIHRVVQVWTDQVEELGRRYRWVQVFENKGEIMGCSNPHPHGQVWAVNDLPGEAGKEEESQRAYYEKQGSPLLLDYVRLEEEQQTRIAAVNNHWAAVVPFWAVWPYETLLLPRRHVPRLTGLMEEERQALAEILKKLLVKYDNLFETSFPYSMGWHGAPTDEVHAPYWQVHAHFLPPLLRSATIIKFMVGYEMLAEAQRDLTPEQAAVRLRSLSDIHYKE